MPKKRNDTSLARRARRLRKSETKSAGRLWGFLRDRQFCGLRFTRQHPIGPYFADFACLSERLIIDIDGEHPDGGAERQADRQTYLERQGWRVLRFAEADVEKDAQAVAVSIAESIGRPDEFSRRDGTGDAKKPREAPPRP